MIKEIKNLDGYNYAFHDDVVGQHYQFHLVNRQHDLKTTMKRTADSFKPLNVANLSLGRFCKNAVTEFVAGTEEGKHLMSLVLEWQDYFNKGGVFDSYKYASQIIMGLDKQNFPVWDSIKEDHKLLDSFIKIPYYAKSFFQIKFLVELDQLFTFMEKVIHESKARKELFYYIKEMSVNESLVVCDSASGEKVKLAIVKLTLLPEVVSRLKNPIVERLTKIFGEEFAQSGVECKMISTFSQEYKPGIFISQGSTNYKKFLFLLQIIEHVYNKETNYAYAI